QGLHRMSYLTRPAFFVRFLSLFLLLAISSNAIAAPEQDSYGLYHFFQKLRNNQQVNVVAIGGSITQAGTGWSKMSADLIAKAYPNAQVKFVNAGISGTGSNLGIFRLERDVIQYQPDLVLVEFAVNDGGAPDKACIRNLESIIVRLRQLPKPPAIVFVQAASKSGDGHHARHNLVAKHHRVMSVDMQKAIADHMSKTGATWDQLFSDQVHPRTAGHEVYAQTLWQRMQAYEQLPAMTIKEQPKLPNLSGEDLILDGKMITPDFEMDGWVYKQESINGWWMQFFQGSLQSGDKAGTLHLPFYGRTMGLWLLIKEGRGKVRLLVDGHYLKDASAFRPDWYYGAYIHPQLFDQGWHVLSIIPLGVNDQPAIARIGYLLLEDQSKAPAPSPEFWKTTWIESRAKADALAKLSWDVIPVESWQVIGPFGGDHPTPWEQPLVDMNKDFGIKLTGQPDTNQLLTGYQGKSVTWQQAKGLNGWVDLKAMYGLKDRGVTYAHVQIKAPADGKYEARISADYFTYITVNGKRAHEMIEGHGSPHNPVPMVLPLKAGVNDVWLTIHAGSMGYGFLMDLQADRGLEIVK
ncbi:MAG TPA: hypothetical protein DCM28_10110, partial [Phycisphaerales bacterium]|nr:hypothetical protein [Phycisphaerales bacterium]